MEPSDLTVTLPIRPSRRGEVPWEIVDQLPLQGEWSSDAYLALDFETPLVELDDGCLEVLPVPDWIHQTIMGLIWLRLRAHQIDGKVGFAVMPPFNLRTTADQYRHPDVMYLKPESAKHFRKARWEYADLIVEVVSEDPRDSDRDYVTKRKEYAATCVPEYWIVDPQSRTLLQLVLDGGATEYREAGTFGPGDVVRAATLPGFDVDFGALLAEAESAAPPA